MLSRAQKSSLTCSHCHKTGHDESTCFALHCTPDWWYEKFGHKAEEGASRGRGRPPPSAPAAGRGRGGVRANATPVEAHLVPGSSGSAPAITPEQWQALFATMPLLLLPTV